MSRVVPLFLQTGMGTECEVCGRRFDLVKGGACVQCRRVLCADHLHGSWARRIAVDLGAQPVCVQCRAGVGPGAAGRGGDAAR